MNNTKPPLRLHSQQLPVTDNKTIALYADQAAVDDLAHRIRDLLPGADKFTDTVLTAFAQISLAHGLDPFIGECWIIPTKRGPRIRAGIEGHRKAARKQSNYQLRQRQMTSEERDAHGLRDTQVAAVTDIYRADSRIEGQAFIPTRGYGIWTPGDQIAKTKTHLWMAYKRSEQDALRKAFDLPFVAEANGNNHAIGTTVGPAPARDPAGSDPTAAPEPALSAGQAAADLYGDWDGAPAPTSAPSADAPPLDKWGGFRTPAAAITWAIRQGAFDGIDDARNAYDNLKENARPKNAQQMAQLWLADVTYRLQATADGKTKAEADAAYQQALAETRSGPTVP